MGSRSSSPDLSKFPSLFFRSLCSSCKLCLNEIKRRVGSLVNELTKSLIGTVLPSRNGKFYPCAARRASIHTQTTRFSVSCRWLEPQLVAAICFCIGSATRASRFPRTKLRRNIFDSQNIVTRKIYDIALKGRRRNYCYNGCNRNWSNRRLLLALTLTKEPANAFERRWRVYSGHSCNLTWSNCRLLLVFTGSVKKHFIRRV